MAEKTYTLEEARAVINDEKRAKREATAKRRAVKGCHPVDVTPGDAKHGVIAKCEHVTGGPLVHGSVFKGKSGDTLYSLDVNPWRYGIVGTLEEVSAKIATLAAHHAETLGWLAAHATGGTVAKPKGKRRTAKA